MDADERAEKIVNKVLIKPFGEKDWVEFKEYIVAQIREAEKEAVDKWVNDAHVWHPKEYCHRYDEGYRKGLNENASKARPDAYQEGRASALEEAAKVAEDGPSPGSVIKINGDVMNTSHVVAGYQAWIAKRIRGLAVEGTK